MNRILSGHDYSDYWLAKMKITQKGECENCRISNTGWHMIFDCPKYNNNNNNNNNRRKFEDFRKTWREPSGKTIRQIIDFIKQNHSEI